MQTASTPHRSADPYLAEALEFTEQDLIANRAGGVTDAQKKRLRRLETKNVLQMIAISLIMFAAVAAFVNVLNNAEEGSALLVILAAIMGSSSAALLLRTIITLVRWYQHANQLQSTPITGPLRLSQFGAEVTENYRSLETKFFIHAGNHHFMIPYEAFVRLRDGDLYTLYYEPVTGHLLAVE